MSRVVLDDFAGHAFMLDLAEAMKRAGHEVTYAYCDTNLSPHADFAAAEVPVTPISTRRPFEKYSVIRRVVNELEYGWGSARLLWRKRAEVSILNNQPLLSLALPLAIGKLTGAHRIIWLQDVQSGLVAGVTGGPLDHMPGFGHVRLSFGDLLATLLGDDLAEFLVAIP